MADDLCNISNATIGRTIEGPIDPETGIPLEDSVSPTGCALMYNKAGDLVKVPTRCHRAPARSLENHYWPRVLGDMLKDNFLQAGVCPHALREQLAKKSGGPARPSMPAPKGVTACDGSGEWSPAWRDGVKYPGCEHLAKVITARHKRTAADAKARRATATIAGAAALADQMAKLAIVGANANAQRDKGIEPAKAPA